MVPDHVSVIEVVQKSTGSLNPDQLPSTEHIISPWTHFSLCTGFPHHAILLRR